VHLVDTVVGHESLGFLFLILRDVHRCMVEMGRERRRHVLKIKGYDLFVMILHSISSNGCAGARSYCNTSLPLVHDWVLVSSPSFSTGTANPGLKAHPLVLGRPTGIELGSFSPDYLYQPGLKGAPGRSRG